MPLDRDIVREMWVLGDLKDRLGIQHRRQRKHDKLEQAPIFHQPHYRSESEISQAEDDYTHVAGYTPGPPRTPASDGSPRPTAPLMAGESPRPEVLEPEHRVSPVSSPTPSDRHQVAGSPAGHRLSYYSVSNLPAPSPLPEVNRYHDYTRDSAARSMRTTYGVEPPMSAVSHSSVTYNPPPASPTHLSPPSSATLQVPGMRQQQQQQQQRAASPAEQYEMRVRSPVEQWAGYPQDPPVSAHAIHTPMATEDSYMTAQDEYEGYEGYEGYAPPSANSQQQNQHQHQHQQEESWRSSTYSYSGPHAI